MNEAPADTLSHLVRLLAPSGTVDLRCRFAGDWAVDHAQAAPGTMPYHLILDGRCTLQLGRTRLELVAGDVLLLPRGSAHLLRHGKPPTRQAPPQRAHNGVLTELSRDGAGPALDMLCGNFMLDGAGAPLLRSLPDHLLVRTAQRADCAWLASLIAMMRHETETPNPGGSAVIGELSTALFTVLLRAVMAERAAAMGLLALMGDARLSRALQAVLRDPARDWTVASLAAECNLSRAAFARRFVQLAGMTPLELVTTLRMELAARLLVQENLAVERVAERCGYASEAAFSRAFKEHHGEAPGAYRRQGRIAA